MSMLLRLINGAVWRKVDSGLKIVDQTHIALASGKLVVQKEDDLTYPTNRQK